MVTSSAARIITCGDFVSRPSIQFGFFYDYLTKFYLWEIGTIPYPHARLIDKLPHELLGRESKWDKQSNLSDLAKRLLIEKKSIFSLSATCAFYQKNYERSPVEDL